jgi:hypothetical protein
VFLNGGTHGDSIRGDHGTTVGALANFVARRALEHREIVCLDHVIDVIEARPPTMTLLDRLEMKTGSLVNESNQP